MSSNGKPNGKPRNLLAERIEEHDIELPAAHPAFDRIFVWPLDKHGEDETFKGTNIIKPNSSKDYFGASRGLLICGGLVALDQLYGHGIELGHVVWYARLSPWRRQYEGTKRICTIVVLRAAEIVGSEDMMSGVKSGAVEIGVDETGKHVIADRADRRVDPEVEFE